MSKPTQSIFPIENGKLTTVLDCNNLQLINLDESNLSGGGGSGNDTGTTTAILKGDGNHGFADAVADSDYATVGSVAIKEDQSAHNSDITTLTDAVAVNTTDIAALTTSVAAKADDAATTAALALKADDADFQDYVTSNDLVVNDAVTDIADLSTALGDKADSASVSLALADKEPLLPTTVNDRYILARRNSSGTDAWYFVDPVTLGTTSQSFTDGVENSTTTFTSATANFVAGDVGKTITGDNIPAATTIASRNSSTSIVLSQAATSTSFGNNFTILNRLEVGGTGTVTSVAANNSITDLLTISVSNPTTSPTLNVSGPSTVGANRFYGNFTGFASTAGFGTAAAARTALGGTTAGQALFQLINPGAISFPQFTALNGAVTRTPAQVLSDIGGESALTFSTPLTRSVGTNVIGIQAAGVGSGAGVSGYLTGSDWVVFNGKVAGTRTITTTAPLTGGGNLNTDRTLAMNVATTLADGYLTHDDFTTFTNKVPQTRTIAATAPLTVTNLGQLNANLTLALPKATSLADGYLSKEDFGTFQTGIPNVVTAGSGGPLVLSASAVPPVTRVLLNQVLTSTLQVTLPPSINYHSGIGFPPIEFVDISGGTSGTATANFAITLNRLGTTSDLVDGGTSVTLPKGMGYLRVNSNGFNRWTTTKYFVDTFKNSLDPTKQVTLDTNQQTSGVPGVVTAANGASLTVKALAPVAKTFLTGLDGVTAGSIGTLTTAQIYGTDVQSNQDDITSTTGNSHIVPNTGTVIDNIRLSATLTAPLTITLPSTQRYGNGQNIYFYDASGSIGSANTVTLVGTGGDGVNGPAGSMVTLNRPFDNRRIIANPATSTWTVEVYGGALGSGLSVGGYTTLADAANILATCDQNLTEQHWKLTGTSGVGVSRTMTISNAREGEKFRLHYTHYTTNDTVIIANAATPGNGLGLLTLSSGAGKIDVIKGSVIFGGKVYVDNPVLDLTLSAAATYTTQADVGTSAGALNQAIGSLANNKYQSGQFVAGSAYDLGRVDVTLRTQGTPANLTGNLFLEVASDAIRSPDAGAIVTAGNPTVTNATTVIASDVGQRVTGDGITDPAYITAVTPGVSFSMSTAKDAAFGVPKSATSSINGINIYGKVGTSLTTSDPFASSTITGTYGAKTFLVPKITTVSGTTYHLVIHTDGATNAVDFVQWRFQSGNTGYVPKNGSAYPPTNPGSAGNKANFITYKP